MAIMCLHCGSTLTEADQGCAAGKHFFFDGTIRENVIFSRPDAIGVEITNALGAG